MPEEKRPELKMVVTVVWDAGGRNALDYWPNAWPNLRRLMRKGTSYPEATIASSPSVTPPIHTTIGTGTFPRQHGVVDINIRRGDEVVGAFEDGNPQNISIPTLADLHDESTGHEALIGLIAERNWHIGMMGHGAYFEGADKDHLALLYEEGSEEELIANTDYYELPEYLKGLPGLDEAIAKVDASDGELDGLWMGNNQLGGRIALQLSPAGVLYQTKLIETFLATEGYGTDDVADLFFTNFKQIDEISHVNGRESEQMRVVLGYADRALAKMVRFLNEQVGRRSWVLALTADHGQGQLAAEVGGWPIDMTGLLEDLNARFEVEPGALIEAQRPSGFWLEQETLEEKGITAEEIANFILGYRARDNVPEDEELPPGYAARLDERLFAAIVPTAHLDRVSRCTRS